MGVRSRVGILQGKIVRSVYVHLDGNIMGVGLYLHENVDQKNIEKFVGEGDRTSVHLNDRYESRVIKETEQEFVNRAMIEGCEYLYLMKEGKWLVCGVEYVEEYGFKFVNLSKVIESEKLN